MYHVSTAFSHQQSPVIDFSPCYGPKELQDLLSNSVVDPVCNP